MLHRIPFSLVFVLFTFRVLIVPVSLFVILIFFFVLLVVLVLGNSSNRSGGSDSAINRNY